jgi:cysteine desulfurase/selenocysteine lyase
MPLDVRQLGCDFLVFSGHKMYAPSGIGVLYGRLDRLSELPSCMLGGGTVKEVDRERQTPQDLPWRFEAGTPNIEGAIALGAAVDYLEEIGFDQIGRHERQLLGHALAGLKSTAGVAVQGPHDALEQRCCSIAFQLDGIDSQVVARILSDRENVMVRAGFHCAHPLHTELGLGTTVRASFGIYNTLEETDAMLAVLKVLKRLF